MSSSRPINFVKALVLASGVSALGSGCGRAELAPPGTDAGGAVADSGVGDAGSRDAGSRDAGSRDAGSGDAGLGDAGAPDAGPFTCAQCICFLVDAGQPECTALGHAECCAAIGPLSPPDLPA